jgi:hypothetical protein
MTRPSLGPTQLSVKGYRDSLHRLNQPVHEVNHCSASSSELVVELYINSPVHLRDMGIVSHYKMDSLGLALPPAQWVEGFFQGSKMAEASHDLFYGDILGAVMCTGSVPPSGWSRVCIVVWVKIFLFSKMTRLALGHQVPLHGLNWAGCEGNH